ncbi:MAG: hypothetical protein IPP46_20690 [Bacteroidetes bacterium]|nr:hypothetical protein [Bacteroidota bacterium]
MNFILHFNLNGNFGHLLPHYLQRENYDLIRSNISQLKIMQGYAQDAIITYGNFDGMNLSNIFEYMDEHSFRETAAAINGSNSGPMIGLLEFNGAPQDFRSTIRNG